MRAALIAAALTLAACDGPQIERDLHVLSVNNSITPASLPAFFDCLREHSWTSVSAHRGGARTGLPESAVSTFDAVQRAAPVFLEIDIRAARDGLVVMHDETVDRTTSGFGDVADLTVAQIQALTLRGSDEHPLSLREALDWANGKTVLELDIKQDVRFEDLVAEVRGAGAMGRVVFITYSVDGASRLARVAPEAMIYATITSVRDLDTLEQRGVDLTHIVAWLGDEELDARLVGALAERGVEARFGVFGRDDRFAEMAEAGVQSLAVDDVAAAYRAADAADGEAGYAALQCAAAQ